MTIKHLVGIAAVTCLASLSGIASANAAPPPPNFQFGIQLGGGNNYDPGPSDSCLSTGEIVADLRAQGYRHVRLIDDSGDTITIDASRRTRVYELEVDSCSGDILSQTRLYHY